MTLKCMKKKIRRISPYCGSTPLNDPDPSPAYADLQGFPKALILCGGWETSLTDSRMLYDGLQKGGNPAKLHVFPGMWHDFLLLFPRLKESRAAWREIVAFITEALSPNGKQERER